VRVEGLGPAEEIAANHNVCARLRDGSVWCWGSNHRGVFGDGTYRDKPVPIMMIRSM
jgi:alpha-tubulin suppressor-like RCC1 family protein